MNITVYTSFSKRKNSTKQPTGGTSVTCDIKHTNSMRQPTFHINKDDLTGGITPESIKYVKDADHSIYYFVDDVEYVPNKFYALHCTIDPMATYKGAITGSTQFVKYSASNYNVMINDARCIPNRTVYIGKHLAQTSWKAYNDVGYYVLDCISNLSLACPEFICHYFMTSADIDNLAHVLFNTNGSDLQSIFDNLKKVVLDPYHSIIGCRWIPLDISTVSGKSMVQSDTIRLGASKVEFGGVSPQGYYITTPSLPNTYSDQVTDTDSVKFEFTAADAGEWRYKDDFRLNSPYTEAQLWLPGYGFIDVNPLNIAYSCTVERVVDMITGDVTILVYGQSESGGDTILLNKVEQNISVEIPIGQMTRKTGEAILGIAGAISGTLFGNVGGGISDGMDAIKKLVPQSEHSGHVTGRSFLTQLEPFVNEYTFDTQDPDDLTLTCGRPLMDKVTLSTLSGYCECMNASVSINGFDADRDIINGYLNSGFYIE